MSQKLTLKVVGEQTMHCAGCERTVTFTLSRLPGVQVVQADHKTQVITIRPESGETDLEMVIAALDWIGYQVAVE